MAVVTIFRGENDDNSESCDENSSSHDPYSTYPSVDSNDTEVRDIKTF